MADAVLNSLRRKLRVYQGAGMDDHARRVKARIKELERPDKPVDKMNKAELVAEAEAQGVTVDESLTKKEIIAVLEEND